MPLVIQSFDEAIEIIIKLPENIAHKPETIRVVWLKFLHTSYILNRSSVDDMNRLLVDSLSQAIYFTIFLLNTIKRTTGPVYL